MYKYNLDISVLVIYIHVSVIKNKYFIDKTIIYMISKNLIYDCFITLLTHINQKYYEKFDQNFQISKSQRSNFQNPNGHF